VVVEVIHLEVLEVDHLGVVEVEKIVDLPSISDESYFVKY